MKSALAALILMLPAVIAQANNWAPIPVPAGLSGFIDADSITSVHLEGPDRLMSVWTKFVHAAPQKDQALGWYKIEKVKYLVDCSNHRLATLEYEPYRADGSVVAYLPSVSESEADQRLVHPPRYSIAEQLIGIVCRH